VYIRMRADWHIREKPERSETADTCCIQITTDTSVIAEGSSSKAQHQRHAAKGTTMYIRYVECRASCRHMLQYTLWLIRCAAQVSKLCPWRNKLCAQCTAQLIGYLYTGVYCMLLARLASMLMSIYTYSSSFPSFVRRVLVVLWPRI
jgi:hypothetical protein